MSSPIVLAWPMDASPGGCSTPPPWHINAVGGRPHHQGGFNRETSDGSSRPVNASRASAENRPFGTASKLGFQENTECPLSYLAPLCNITTPMVMQRILRSKRILQLST